MSVLSSSNKMKKLFAPPSSKWLFVLLCLIFSLASISAQSRKELEEKRQQLLKEISLTSKLLNETKKNKAAELDRFIALQNQVMAREKLLQNLQKEVNFVDEQLSRTHTVIGALEDDIQRLEKEYGVMLRSAYRQKIRNTGLLFLLSSKNLNQAFRRWQYMRQYDRYRKKQAGLIMKTKSTLQDKISILEDRKKEKELLLRAEESQKNMLLAEFDAKNKILKSLKKDESKLLADLKQKKSNHERLNQAIELAIQEEVMRSRENLRDAASLAEERPELVRSDIAFSDRKGRLTWPVENSVISSYFGTQPHPTLQNITITNNGIDLLTDKGAKVKAVHPGVVVTRQFIPGHDYMLIVKHGNFYTVYSNLEATYIRKDQPVQLGQPIGQVKQDPKTGKSEVHFEVWRDKERLNPVEWLKKR